jgi:hypothetical protein
MAFGSLKGGFPKIKVPGVGKAPKMPGMNHAAGHLNTGAMGGARNPTGFTKPPPGFQRPPLKMTPPRIAPQNPASQMQSSGKTSNAQQFPAGGGFDIPGFGG